MSSPKRISPPAHVKGQLTAETNLLTPARVEGRFEGPDDDIVRSRNLSILSIFPKRGIIQLATYSGLVPISMS